MGEGDQATCRAVTLPCFLQGASDITRSFQRVCCDLGGKGCTLHRCPCDSLCLGRSGFW